MHFLRYVLIAGAIVSMAGVAVSHGAEGKKPAIEVRKITPEDNTVLEEWERVTKEPDILGVNAAKVNQGKWTWQVFIHAAEFVRKEPLEGRLVKNITAALQKVEGVRAVVREDREVWIVQGEASGENLVRACAVALDQMEPEIRQHIADL